MRPELTLAKALIWGVALWSPSLHAEGDPSGRARQHFERGYALAEQRNFDAAIAEFEQAQAISPNVSLLYNLGQAYAAAGRSADAVSTLERYLSQAGEALSPERRRQAETLIRYHAARVGRIALEIEPAGASVVVDGKDRGQAPLAGTLAVAAGQHAVLVSAPGYEPHATSLDVPAQQVAAVKVALRPRAQPTLLRVVCAVPDVRVLLDGVVVGTSGPLSGLPVATGTHRVEFSRPGYVTDRRELAVAPGTSPTVTCALSSDPAGTGHGKLRVQHPVGTRVFVNGAPFRGQALPHGAHEVQVNGPEHETETRRLVLAPRVTQHLTMEPAPRSQTLLVRDAERRRTLRLVAYASAGAGLVSAAVATGLYLHNSSRWSDWDDTNEALRKRSATPGSVPLREVDALLGEESKLRDRDGLALGLGIVGGALMAGGVALFVGSRPVSERWVVTAGARTGIAYAGEF
jgi:hypothetical protein